MTERMMTDIPALPRKRIERKKWTEAEIVKLLSMVERFKSKGIRPRWREIAAATGHHENSCVVKYHAIRSRAADLETRKEIDAAAARPKFKAPAAHRVPLKPLVENPEFGRGVSTHRLQVDAELRRLIGAQGITAGLLGDPPPGPLRARPQARRHRRRAAGGRSSNRLLRLAAEDHARHGATAMKAFRLSFTTRAISRAQWKVLWRQLRIVNREVAIASEDCAIFGTGFLETGPQVQDFIRRVHPSNVAIGLMEPRP